MKEKASRKWFAQTCCAAALALVVASTAPGCRSTPLAAISPEPSTLEKVVAAMRREEWDEADRLLTPILPPLSTEGGSAEVERSVALRQR